MTRAQQFEILAAGVLYNGATITTPYASFTEAGTTTPKLAFADIEKSVSFTKKALDTQGRAMVYGDGIYKIRIYSGDPDNGGTFTGIEIDNYKVRSDLGAVRTITQDTVGTVDDSLVLVDTTTGNISYTLPNAELMTGETISVKKTVTVNILTIIGPMDGVPTNSLVDKNATIQYKSNGVFWTGVQIVGTASTLGGYSVSTTAVAGTIPVYNVDAAIPGDITGNAVTATTAGHATTADTATNTTTADSANTATYAADSDKVDGLHAAEIVAAGSAAALATIESENHLVLGDNPSDIQNGDFEVDKNAATALALYTLTTLTGGTVALGTDLPSGEQTVSMIHPGGAGNGGGKARSPFVACVAGTVLTREVTHWATAAGMKCQVIFFWFTSADVACATPSTTVYDSTTNPTTRTLDVFTATPPATAAKYKLEFVGGEQSVNVVGTAYFADGNSTPDHWTLTSYPSGSIARNTALPISGKACLAMTHPGGAAKGGGYAVSDYRECSEIEAITLKMLHYSTSAGMKNQVILQWFTKAKAACSTAETVIYESVANPTSAAVFLLAALPPSTARFYKVKVVGGESSVDVSGTAYFDKVSVIESLRKSSEISLSGALSVPVFNGINKIIFTFNQVSAVGTGYFKLRLNSVNTGYRSAIFSDGGSTLSTAEIIVSSTALAAATCSGVVTFNLVDRTNNIWVWSGTVANHSGGACAVAGSMTLASQLTSIQIESSGGNMDGGTAKITQIFE